MFEDVFEAIFWAIPIISTAITAVILALAAYRDGSKGKVMFALAFALASIGYTPRMLEEAGIPFPYLSVRWAFIPMIAAIYFFGMKPR